MADILVRREGAIGTLVFSNVDKHNAMTGQMWESLPARLAELDEDPAIRVIVLTVTRNLRWWPEAMKGHLSQPRRWLSGGLPGRIRADPWSAHKLALHGEGSTHDAKYLPPDSRGR